MNWLSSLVQKKISNTDEFFEKHRKVWKGESKINLDVKMME